MDGGRGWLVGLSVDYLVASRRYVSAATVDPVHPASTGALDLPALTSGVAAGWGLERGVRSPDD